MLANLDEFSNELLIFKNEVDTGLSFLYSWLTLREISKNSKVLNLFNTAPHFWNTVTEALLVSTLIRLGRIFDSDSNAHSVHRLIRILETNLSLFSLHALAQRKSFLKPKDLKNYLSKAYIPTSKDIRNLKRYINKRKKIYRENYSELRNKIFAHHEILNSEVKTELFENTNIKELQLLLISLSRVHDALWSLLQNGRKPILRPQRYSIREIRKTPSPKFRYKHTQEHLIEEIDKFFNAIIDIN